MNFFDNIFKDKISNEKMVVYGFNTQLNSIYIYNKFINMKSDLYVVCNSLYQASIIEKELCLYTNDVLLFVNDDFLTSVALTTSPELNIERMLTLKELSTKKNNKIIVIDLLGYLTLLPSRRDYFSNVKNIKLSDEINREELIKYLDEIGYDRVLSVEKTGEFSVRGFVIDIFLLDYDTPIRIEFFDDEVDSIRSFDIVTQLSNNKLEEVFIYPIKVDFSYNNQITNYSDNFEVMLYDYQQIKVSYTKLEEDYLEYSTNVENVVRTFCELDDLRTEINTYILGLDNYNLLPEYETLSLNCSKVDNYSTDISKLEKDINRYLKDEKTIIFCLSSDGLNRFKKNDFTFDFVYTNEDNIFSKKVNVIEKSLNDGFIYNNFIVISDNNIFSNNSSNFKYKNNFKIGTKIKEIDSLSIGDYVIHINNGIGIYDGLVSLTRNDITKDYLKIMYKSDDKLYVPVEKINLISKFQTKDGAKPKLHQLGGSLWAKTKVSLQKKLENIALDLIKISALREQERGFKFNSDTKEQYEFERDCSFEPTQDQLRATNEIKLDMEKQQPMDRLLCGDVGYGKTEVAFRAMFKAVMDSKQVMYLAPTTILSSQQYKSAIKRFRNFGVNIELLNRFATPKNQKEIIKRVKEGKVDILMGTHRLLSNDVEFRDLGLLVIDEEQRFGVKHKEKMKQKANNVDILTLSATPIPRTLQMSLSSLKQLSLIETAPVNRYPVVTYVISENDYVLKDAIYKELSRNGQIFILYNKVETIIDIQEKIKKLIPEARVTHAHGQMSKSDIENKMMSFINHDFDILICTTIIETGIDIPNSNTLIVIDADNFGLSQLYQLRGRVGRSDRLAYCYLMYKENKSLSEISVKRLETIKNFTNLGSGFKIAMRDLSIRGAGDILGKEQSGFIDSVGVDLYMRMLDDEVKKINNEYVEEEELDKPLIDVNTHIDDSYTSDEEIKLELHNLINTVDSYERIIEVKNEIKDRFGKVDDNLTIYMYEEWFEKLCKRLNIKSVEIFNNVLTIYLSKELSQKQDGNELLMKSYEINENIQLIYKHERIGIVLNIKSCDKHYLYYVTKLLDFINY